MPSKRKRTVGETPVGGDTDGGTAVVLPGDDIDVPAEGDLVIGPGLRRVGERVSASKCGVLRSRGSGAFWVDTSTRRAVPAVGDEVLGTVVGKPGEVFSVDVGGSRPATLPYLKFEGATKRNRPSVDIGDLVFCRVVAAGKDIEPELSCVNASGKSGGLGKLTGGYAFKCSTGLCRSLRAHRSPILDALSPHVAFEIAAGLNGRVWVRGETPEDTILVCNAIQSSEHMTHPVAVTFVKELLTRMPPSARH